MKKNIAILGSTGSIGTQTLDIIRLNPDLFDVYLLTANNNVDLLIRQAREFRPEIVVIANDQKYHLVQEALADLPIKVWCGAEAIADAVTAPDIDMVVTGMVGYSGLLPTIKAIEARKMIALANKETLVVAGELIMRLVQENQVPILPVDSEHSAIFQTLLGERQRPEKILLTASGGPFLHLTAEELQHVTREQALRHPNWNMGAKVTIDSASLMNKGFEMIEAKWLFEMQPDEIEILVHPQSIIHSMVQFRDGSVKAQLGIPDMRLPISYALGITHRIPNDYPRVDFTAAPLTFERPDLERFPNLSYAFDAIRLGGNAPCALNAANEIAVAAFLRDEISFTDMSRLLYEVMEKHELYREVSLPTFIETDSSTRRVAQSLLPKFRW
ncbi:1-deoxy-D-xylulose 5-phosphate reductoisomerase [Porphyromonas gulae]|uniref:1-deoxy-D-xylulose-5-phosphate reductoisomerase n=1 Tax=Porphyromonas gulae TaxID=111105 RepID=UPI00052C509D|nr:1-deoxy-D-xylulose-5-phosphate reductoisomerase [Porphyromonas gulae]KGN77362.1 1-deoxy-D-xylulose 5-phosphate reductoisomerase [Porphyromonas gulae]KGO04504.1 1-deoxy-D-xylulose 5-phosphate reductoisomerase [Porphyromonas gulae]